VERVKWWTRVGWFLDRVVADREPGKGSSIAPRRPDGTRNTIFGFNGNGRGRYPVAVAGRRYDAEDTVAADGGLRAALHAKRYLEVVGHDGRADVLGRDQRAGG